MTTHPRLPSLLALTLFACGDDGGLGFSDGGGPDGPVSCEPTLVYPPELLPECPMCEGARCVAGDELTANERADLMDCSPSHECLPDEYLLAGDAYVPPTCEAAFGAEGRCLSTCLPGVMEEGDVLARDVCPSTHRCVPCFDPFRGEPTGACDAICDTGAEEAPVVLPTCCEDRGSCVPAASVAEEDRPYYDTCEDDGLCVPTVIATTPGYVPARCTADAIAERYGAQYGPGICAHECQAGLDEVASFLERNDCDDDFLCVPCLDPETGEPSGACPTE